MNGLAFHPEAALRHLCRAEPAFRPLVERVPFGLTVPSGFSPFEALATSIAYQQLTGKAAATIVRRLKALFPHRRFPHPEDIAEADVATLRTAGLSGAKAAALKDLAEKALSGVVPPSRVIRRMDDEALIERLTQVRGVGRWTVEMLLIFRLGRPDVLPVSDYGVRKGFALLFRRPLPTPKELESRGERWRPYRTVASWYLWRAVDGQAAS